MIAPSAREVPLPAAITRGGRRGWLAALVAGVIFGGVTLLVPSLLSRDTAFGLLAILLGMIASVYLGYALNDGRLRAFQAESVGMVAFAALATVALARSSPAAGPGLPRPRPMGPGPPPARSRGPHALVVRAPLPWLRHGRRHLRARPLLMGGTR